ncbi:MAG: hypothetical protein JSV66_12845 [Trueperaceae bacterium]|nr:MAG: hypothetical protein JSV66_12845 [Trueperaceae bacterium]
MSLGRSCGDAAEWVRSFDRTRSRYQVTEELSRVLALPYFVQLGGHVAEDLPNLIGQAQRQHAGVLIESTEHLSFDELLASVIADRVAHLVA